MQIATLQISLFLCKFLSALVCIILNTYGINKTFHVSLGYSNKSGMFWGTRWAADSESFLVQHRFMRFKYHLTLLEMILGAYH